MNYADRSFLISLLASQRIKGFPSLESNSGLGKVKSYGFMFLN